MENRVKNTQIINDFDYNILESNQRSLIRQRTEEIKERLKRSAQDIWEIGQKLYEVRAQLAYGYFDNWLKAEFGWSRRTAYNFIQVYEAFPERAAVAQVNIAASALYQLSSPSTPKEVRDEFIQRAKKGEKITRQNIRQVVKQETTPVASDCSTANKPVQINKPQQQIISVLPKNVNEVKLLAIGAQKQQPKNNSAKILPKQDLQQGNWYTLAEKHFLFYGDTALPQFHQVIPQVKLAIAITSNDWDHDWLVDKAENLMVLQESLLQKEPLPTLISLLSERGDTILFPWLPDEKAIKLAHQLERIIIAGDPVLEHCQRAIAVSELEIKQIGSLCF